MSTSYTTSWDLTRGGALVFAAAALLASLLTPAARAATTPCAPGISESTRQAAALTRAAALIATVTTPPGSAQTMESQKAEAGHGWHGQEAIAKRSWRVLGEPEAALNWVEANSAGLRSLVNQGRGHGSLGYYGGGSSEWLAIYTSSPQQPGYIFSEELHLWLGAGEGESTTLTAEGNVGWIAEDGLPPAQLVPEGPKGTRMPEPCLGYEESARYLEELAAEKRREEAAAAERREEEAAKRRQEEEEAAKRRQEEEVAAKQREDEEVAAGKRKGEEAAATERLAEEGAAKPGVNTPRITKAPTKKSDRKAKGRHSRRNRSHRHR